MSHPIGLPDLFIDRSLGRIKVPRLLRDADLRLTTLAEHYGVPADEKVADSEWLELVGRRGWVALAKDAAVRHKSYERAVIQHFAVQYFYLSGQSLSAENMASRILRHLPRIAAACAEGGPLLFAVHESRLEQIPLVD